MIVDGSSNRRNEPFWLRPGSGCAHLTGRGGPEARPVRWDYLRLSVSYFRLLFYAIFAGLLGTVGIRLHESLASLACVRFLFYFVFFAVSFATDTLRRAAAKRP